MIVLQGFEGKPMAGICIDNRISRKVIGNNVLPIGAVGVHNVDIVIDFTLYRGDEIDGFIS